jgi:hypothetical protein
VFKSESASSLYFPLSGLAKAEIFERGDDIRIQTQRYGLLRESVELADFGFAAMARTSPLCRLVSFLIG